MTISIKRTPVALYMRVSSERQDIENSIGKQRDELTRYCEYHNFEIVAIFIDEARSGRTADREQFKEMIRQARLKKHPFEKILVRDFSRFARNAAEHSIHKTMLARANVDFIAISQPIEDEDSPIGKLLDGFFAILAEFYSNNLGEEVRAGRKRSASTGAWTNSTVPFGFEAVRKIKEGSDREKTYLEPVEPQATSMRRMFAVLLENKTHRQTRDILRAEGRMGPNGKDFTKDDISRLSRNKIYAGLMETGRRSKRKNTDIQIVQLDFTPLVSPEDFERIRLMTEERAWGKKEDGTYRPGEHPRNSGSIHLLSDLLKCAIHNNPNTGQPESMNIRGGGDNRCYTCRRRIEEGKDAGCHPLPKSEVERYVMDTVFDEILTEENIRGVLKRVEENTGEATIQARKDAEDIDRKLAGLDRSQRNLQSAVENEVFTQEEARGRMQEIREQRSTLQSFKENTARVLEKQDALVKNAKALVEDASALKKALAEGDDSLKKTLLRSFVRRIVVHPGNPNVLSFEYKIPEIHYGSADSEVEQEDLPGASEKMSMVLPGGPGPGGQGAVSAGELDLGQRPVRGGEGSGGEAGLPVEDPIGTGDAGEGLGAGPSEG